MSKIVYAKTHAEFLNKIYGTNYKNYMRGRWSYDYDTWVWMVRMDGAIRDGWVNKIINENEIHEEYVWAGEPGYTSDRERRYRIAVQIIDMPGGMRVYNILGKYRYDFAESTYKKHVLKKVEEIQ